MTNVQAIFPKAVATWTDRVDQINTVFANDPNALASEVIAIEKTLGVMPQVEKNPIIGSPVTYASVDARLSAIQNGQHLPVCALRNNAFYVRNDVGPGGVLNTYQALFDPFKMYNGIDVTLPVPGWYIISASQRWDWWDSGWNRQGIYINGTGGLVDEFFVRWDLAENVPGAAWYQREMSSSVFWQGPLSAGTRISIQSENGTTNKGARADYLTLRVACIQRLPASSIVPIF